MKTFCFHLRPEGIILNNAQNSALTTGAGTVETIDGVVAGSAVLTRVRLTLVDAVCAVLTLPSVSARAIVTCSFRRMKNIMRYPKM